MRAFDGGDDALALAQVAEGVHGLFVGGPAVVHAADVLEPRVLGSDRGVVEARGDGVRVERLALVGLQQVALRALEHAELAGARGEADRVPAGLRAVAAGLVAVQVHALVVEEGVHHADGVGAAAHAGADRIRVVDAVPVLELLLGLLADDLLEVAHHRGERVRAGDRAEQVVGVLDVGHPVAQGLVDRVLEDLVAERHLDDLGAEHAHAGHVEGLAAGVDLAHVDAALEAEHRAHGGRGHAVLAGAGLGDHAGLAHALDEQGLAERVVDLVRAGVVEVLALEEDAGVEAGPVAHHRGEARGLGQRARAADVALLQGHELLVEFGIGLGLIVDALQLVQRGDQRLRHVPAAELAPVRSLMFA